MANCSLCKAPASLKCSECKGFFSCKKCSAKLEISSHLSSCTVDGEKRSSAQTDDSKSKKTKVDQGEPLLTRPIPIPFEERKFLRNGENEKENFDGYELVDTDEIRNPERRGVEAERLDLSNRNAILRMFLIDPDRYKDTEDFDVYNQEHGTYRDFREDMRATLRLSANDWITLWSRYECVPIFFLLQKIIYAVGVLSSVPVRSYDYVVYMTGSDIPVQTAQEDFEPAIMITYAVINAERVKAWKLIQRIIQKTSLPIENAIYKFLLGMSVVKKGGVEKNFLRELNVGPALATVVANSIAAQLHIRIGSYPGGGPNLNIMVRGYQEWIADIFDDTGPGRLLIHYAQ